jgi:hypothetical protein
VKGFNVPVPLYLVINESVGNTVITPESVGRVLRRRINSSMVEYYGVAAANFAMESDLLLNRTGALCH